MVTVNLEALASTIVALESNVPYGSGIPKKTTQSSSAQAVPGTRTKRLVVVVPSLPLPEPERELLNSAFVQGLRADPASWAVIGASDFAAGLAPKSQSVLVAGSEVGDSAFARGGGSGVGSAIVTHPLGVVLKDRDRKREFWGDLQKAWGA